MAALTCGAVPIAAAEPAELDIEAYENCVEKAVETPNYLMSQVIEYCCVDSGGAPKTSDDGIAYDCNAPSAEPRAAAPPAKPGFTPLPHGPANDSVG
jgi:hypothetical protein